MNAPFAPELTDQLPTTRAGEGYDRHAWTVDQLFAMVDVGLLWEGAPVELIEGELLAVNAKYNEHEIWKRNMAYFLIMSLNRRFAVSVEPTLKLSEFSAPEPDIVVTPRGMLPLDVRGPDVLLLIEVTDSSTHRDLVMKAKLYARHDVSHYWVLDAVKRRVVAHAAPGPLGYESITVHDMQAEVPLPFDGSIILRVADLETP